jgi:hypothetical protein
MWWRQEESLMAIKNEVLKFSITARSTVNRWIPWPGTESVGLKFAVFVPPTSELSFLEHG